MRALGPAVAFVLGFGCGGKLVAPPSDCVDRDDDGFGIGADCRGGDCDDTDPLAHDVCAPACEAGSRAPGCPCEPGPIADPCYTGPEGTADVGICRSGVRRCRDAVWTSCEDEVLPEPNDGDAEVVCDGEDDDCDGVIDDGVVTACGDCNPDCKIECAGVGCNVELRAGPGTELRAGGALVSVPRREPPDDVWIAMRGDGSVLRVARSSYTPVARYLLGPSDGTAAVAVVLDGMGDAYALETSLDGYLPSAVVGIRSQGCEDRDGDGAVTTSEGEDALPWGADDCVHWRVALNPCGHGACGTASGLALTGDGENLWVSIEDLDRVLEVDTTEGLLSGRSFDVGLPGPLATDAELLWVGGPGWLHRVPLANPVINRRDDIPSLQVVTSIEIGPAGAVYAGAPLAILDTNLEVLVAREPYAQTSDLTLDLGGNVWSAQGTPFVTRWTADLEDEDAFDVPGAPETLAVDRAGNIWAATEQPPAVVVVDAETGRRIADGIDCRDCLRGPVLSGDPSGMRFERVHGATWTEGEAGAVFTVRCEGGEIPLLVSVGADVADGAVEVELRTAPDLASLPDAEWHPVGVFPPADDVRPDPLAEGSAIELALTLLEPGTVVERVDVEWTCLFLGQ